MGDCTREFETRSPSQTRDLGRALGRLLEAGCVIALHGDLGSGKTCFTSGLAQGLGLPEEIPVTSPSYTLVNEYPCRLILQHADLYRLEGADLDDIGFYDLEGPDSVVVVEWANLLDPRQFNPDLTIFFETPQKGVRKILFRATGQFMGNLIFGLKFST